MTEYEQYHKAAQNDIAKLYAELTAKDQEINTLKAENSHLHAENFIIRPKELQKENAELIEQLTQKDQEIQRLKAEREEWETLHGLKMRKVEELFTLARERGEQLTAYKETLKEIESLCNNQNPTHEAIWKIVYHQLNKEK